MEPESFQSDSDLPPDPRAWPDSRVWPDPGTRESALGSATPQISPEPKWQPSDTSVFLWQQQQRRKELEQELAKTREELQAMQTLLEELPALFENKFRQRLQPMLEQQQRLLEDNANLRQRLLPMPNQQDRPRMRQALLHAFGLNSNNRAT